MHGIRWEGNLHRGRQTQFWMISLQDDKFTGLLQQKAKVLYVFSGAPLDSYYGNGLMGQRVIVSPSQDLVIVRLGLNYNDDFDQASSLCWQCQRKYSIHFCAYVFCASINVENVEDARHV